jgi:hypothetical protein
MTVILSETKDLEQVSAGCTLTVVVRAIFLFASTGVVP